MREGIPTYEYEGRQVTAAEIAAELPIYSRQWITTALKDGCTTRLELDKRRAAGEVRQRTQWAGHSKRLHPRAIPRVGKPGQ